MLHGHELFRADAAVDDMQLVPRVLRGEDHRLAAREMADARDELRPSDLGVDAPVLRLVKLGRPVHREAVGEPAERRREHRDGTARVGKMVVQVGEVVVPQPLRDEPGLEKISRLQRERLQPGGAGGQRDAEGGEVAAG
jgi:hypothetical protein